MKKQLNKQAFLFSLILFLSWFSFASFVLIPDLNKEYINNLKYTFPEQLQALVPAAVMIVLTLALNYILKPDLSKYFKMHVSFGLVTILLCTLILISFIVLPTWADGPLHANLALLHINLYWIVPAVSLLIETVICIRQRLYKNPKALLVLLVSNAGICMILTYLAELYFIFSRI